MNEFLEWGSPRLGPLRAELALDRLGILRFTESVFLSVPERLGASASDSGSMVVDGWYWFTLWKSSMNLVPSGE